MLKKLYILSLMIGLFGCVSEPVDPAFIGTGAIDKNEAAKTRVSLGLTYLKNGNYQQAKTNLDKALEFAPRSGEAHYAMAFYFQQVGENALAEEYYENALGFSRNAPDVVNSYGVFLCQQGQYDKAKGFFLEAVSARNYSATAETYENLAICAQSDNKREEAIQYFNLALNHQPTRASSLYLLSQLYVETEQWEDAKKTLWRYERNAQVSPESLFLNYQIAQGLNDMKSAVGYGDLLVQMYPQHDNTQRYLEQMGKFKPAAKVTRKLPPIQEAETIEKSIESEVDTVVETLEQSPASEALASENTEQRIESALGSAKDTIEQAPSTEVLAVDGEEALERVEDALTSTDDNTDAAVVIDETVQTDDNSGQDSQEDDAVWHIVKPKENLYRISLKYNVKMASLMQWNGIAEPSDITIGTRLRVKEPGSNE